MDRLDPTPAPRRAGNAAPPYTWPAWDEARARGILGRSGLSEAELARLVAKRRD